MELSPFLQRRSAALCRHIEKQHKKCVPPMVQLWEGWREVENTQKWAQLWCALSSSLRLCEMWMSHWVLFRLGTMFGITKDRYLPEYLYDWESFASERNAVMWNKLEPGVLVQSGCKIFSGLLCLCWFKVIFCLELCTGCPVIWNLGVFFFKEGRHLWKTKTKTKTKPQMLLLFPPPSPPCPTEIRGQEIANFLGPSPQQVLYPGS